MPRRDGQPTLAELAAAQQPAPAAGGQLPPAEAARAALAATRAAAGTAATAPPVVAPVVTVAAVNAAAAGILTAFGQFLDSRRRDQEAYLSQVLEAEIPELGALDRQQVISDEMTAEQAYAAKMRARLDRDLPKALSIADPDVRESEVQKILDRERRFAEMRESAMASRALGVAEQRHVEIASPAGGYWHLSDHTQEHTLDCLAMGGKVWPHSVLRNYHPPLHGGCPCEIWPIDRAEQAGLLHSPEQYATPDQSLQAMQIAEAEFDDDELDEELAVLEAFYDARWGKGTTKAGQFRPKRGGDPGAVLHHRHLSRMRLPASMAVAPVPTLDRQLDVRDLRVADLAEGDHVMVNGNLERVTKVHSATPGLVELEHTGLAHIDRDTIQGIAGDEHAPEAGGHGLPDLPTYGPDDRFELRYGPDASLIMWDRHANKPYAIWDSGWDLEAVKQGVAEDNTAHRAQVSRDEPAPVSPLGGLSHEDLAKLARVRRPKAAGELAPGVHYSPSASKLESRPEGLHVPPSFFEQAPGLAREKLLFGHFGGQLAGSLGSDGIGVLAAQDSHLSSPKAVGDTYYALNTGGRQRMVDLHPDAARLVATAAHERGLPLHPEAAKLIRQPAVADATPAEHPAHALAAKQIGLRCPESRDHLAEAGYTYGGSQKGPEGSPTLVSHNHDAGASILTTFGADDKVVAARADIPAAVPAAEASRVVGQGSSAAVQSMSDQGFSPGYTTARSPSGQEWLRFVHPDGRGRALRVADDQTVEKVAAFTPTDREISDAHRVVLHQDPLSQIKPGDGYQQLHEELTAGMSGFRIGHAGETADGRRFTTYRAPAGRDDHITVFHDTERVTGAGIAHPDFQGHPGQTVTPFELQAARQAAQAKEDERRRAAAAEQAGAAAKITDAIAKGDSAGLKKALGGRGVADGVRLLQQHGFELRARRRAGRGSNATITYTLRGPNGETVKITGEHTFSSGAITKIAIAGNPQGGKRTRLPAGQAPKNLNELLTDALGRADELGQRYDAGVHVTGIVQGGVGRRAAAHHELNGTIAIRKSYEGKEIAAYLKKRQAGQPLSDSEHLGYYNHVETIQHEINHGVGKRGDQPGGLAFGPRHYQGLGKNVEEALTEENGHLLAADWLRSHGMTDVLAAVKRNPQDRRVLGVYQRERVQLKRILDDANVPASERAALLARMKFQMTPGEQHAELMRLAGTDNLMHAMYGMGRREDAKRRADMERNFEPATRPDLSDIATEATATTPDGRTLGEGQTVEADTGDGQVAGVITGIRTELWGVDVRVRTDDGLELWYPTDRIH